MGMAHGRGIGLEPDCCVVVVVVAVEEGRGCSDSRRFECERSHNATNPALLGACDRLGILVMDETREFGSNPQSTRRPPRSYSTRPKSSEHHSLVCWQ